MQIVLWAKCSIVHLCVCVCMFVSKCILWRLYMCCSVRPLWSSCLLLSVSLSLSRVHSSSHWNNIVCQVDTIFDTCEVLFPSGVNSQTITKKPNRQLCWSEEALKTGKKSNNNNRNGIRNAKLDTMLLGAGNLLRYFRIFLIPIPPLTLSLARSFLHQNLCNSRFVHQFQHLFHSVK